jgi:hypothetical protein
MQVKDWLQEFTMGDDISINNIRVSSNVCVKDTDNYQIMADGRFCYTPEGVRAFSGQFREHGIDIRKIESIEDHEVALDICATESVLALKQTGNGILDLEIALLRSIMMSPDNTEALAIEKKLSLRKRMSRSASSQN